MEDGDILGKVKLRYEEKRNRAANDRRIRIDEIRKKYPRIAEIDSEIFRLGAENLIKISAEPDKAEIYNKQLKDKYAILELEKKQLIMDNNIDPDYDKYVYVCRIFSFTGYDSGGIRCSCFNQEMINEIFEMGEFINSLKYENFDTLSYEYYSPGKGEGDLSERDNMMRIVKRTRHFCDHFYNTEKSLLFNGGTGLGKTFLSKCAAKELMQKGITVAYARAGKLFKLMEDYKFGRDESGYKTDYIYSADLLIIDDLGTENSSSVNVSFLDDVINNRIEKKKKMIISTNMSLEELRSVYSGRLLSRIAQFFIINRFYGKDIRIQKI